MLFTEEVKTFLGLTTKSLIWGQLPKLCLKSCFCPFSARNHFLSPICRRGGITDLGLCAKTKRFYFPYWNVTKVSNWMKQLSTTRKACQILFCGRKILFLGSFRSVLRSCSSMKKPKCGQGAKIFAVRKLQTPRSVLSVFCFVISPRNPWNN